MQITRYIKCNNCDKSKGHGLNLTELGVDIEQLPANLLRCPDCNINFEHVAVFTKGSTH